MAGIARPHPRLRRLFRAWRADSRGVAAIEFAFVAGPFLFLIFGIIELALVFLLSTSLDSAADQAGRRIRTGQFQTAGQTAADFKAEICDNMVWLAGNCSTALSVDVRTYEEYAEVVPIDPVEEDEDGKKEFDEAAMQFAATLPAETIVVVRAYYRWPLITPLINQGLGRLDGGVALVTTTQTFITEPYS